MKDIVIKKKFGTAGEYIICKEKGDKDKYCLQYTDEKLKIKLSILPGGDTDGGSIPNFAKSVFDPLLDKTAHGFIFHDELWRHRVYYKELYEKYGITFHETNRIMKDIHKKASCSWFEQNLTRIAVRWFGWFKWLRPEERIKKINKPTLIIEKV
jgi:hypothetical protein